MNCDPHLTTRIKHVYGNVLRLAIPLTLRSLMKDGDTVVATDSDFIPSSEYPVNVVFGKGNKNIAIPAEMDGNVAIIEEKGKMPVGTYDITVECRDDLGQPYRFKKDTVLQVVDVTAEAGIEPTIEYEAQTWYLDAAVFLATTEIGSMGEEIERRLEDVFGDVDYDAENKVIKFYDKNKTHVLGTIDSRPFIVDGTVDDVYIDVSRQVLVVILNEDAGGRRFSVPLYLVFDNYYKKDEVDSKVDHKADVLDDGRLPGAEATPVVLDYIYAPLSGSPIIPINPQAGEVIYFANEHKIRRYYYEDAGQSGGLPAIVYVEETPSRYVVYYNKRDEKFYRYDAGSLSMVEIETGSGGGEGTVTGVKVGGTTYEPTNGVVDISASIPDVSGFATAGDVADAVADLVDSAPATLDTLNELAAALGDDPNFATTMATALGNKVDKVSGKGLSTEDYTTAEKTKLAGIEAGAKNSTMIVKVNSINQGLEADHTFAEIAAAIEDGKNVVVINTGDEKVYQLSYIDPSEVYFTSCQGDEGTFSCLYFDELGVEFAGEASIPSIDNTLSNSSTSPVQNKVITAALAGKANSSDLASVATSGSYNDLSNKPTLFSGNYNDLSNKPTIPDVSGLATKSEVATGLATKQDTLTFDNSPTANSNNVVRSGGIKQAIDEKLTEVTLTEISGAADIVVIDDADLAFIDQSGNIAMQVANGHIQTSEFDSAQVSQQVAANTASVASINQQIAGVGGQSDVAVKNDGDAPFDISDAAGNVVLRVNGQGHVSTKRFNSQFAAMTLETPMCICHAVSSPLGDAYNHTMKHFRTAIARGHQFIECDGYNCMDGVPVCAHNSSYSFYVRNSTTGETASKSFSSINSADLIAGYTWTAPTIENGVITEYGEPIIKVTDLVYFVCYIHRCNLYIDAKGMNTQSVKNVLDYAESIGCRQLVWIEPSNNAISLSGVQCNICAASVTLQNMASVVTNYKRDGYNLMLQLVKSGATSQMRRDFAEAAHSYGCYAYTWSMNSAQETRGWFDDGFDFIFTEGYSTVTWYITKYTVFNLQ